MSVEKQLEEFLSKYGSLYEASGGKPELDKLSKKLSGKKETAVFDSVLDLLWEHPDISFYRSFIDIKKKDFFALMKDIDIKDAAIALRESLSLVKDQASHYFSSVSVDKNDVVNSLWNHPDIATFCKIKGCNKKEFVRVFDSFQIDDVKTILSRAIDLIESGILDSSDFDLMDHIKNIAVHFNSKIVHSQAGDIGVFVGPKMAKPTPYLCASSIMHSGEDITLDQTVNDNGGIYQAWLKKYNKAKKEKDVSDIKNDIMFKDFISMENDNNLFSKEVGEEVLDGNLKQIILPNPNVKGEYIAFTPLVSPGVCKIVCDKWEENKEKSNKWNANRYFEILPVGGSIQRNVCINENAQYVRSPFVAYVPSVFSSNKRALRFLHVGADGFCFKVNKETMCKYYKWLLSNRGSSFDVVYGDSGAVRNLADESGFLSQKAEASLLRDLVRDYIFDIESVSSDISNLLKNKKMNLYLEEKGWVENGQWEDGFLSSKNDLDFFIITGRSKNKTKKILVKNITTLINGYYIDSEKSIVLSEIDKNRIGKVLLTLIREWM